jgi:hypothetical protein
MKQNHISQDDKLDPEVHQNALWHTEWRRKGLLLLETKEMGMPTAMEI